MNSSRSVVYCGSLCTLTSVVKSGFEALIVLTPPFKTSNSNPSKSKWAKPSFFP